jgi:hypothetical protein
MVFSMSHMNPPIEKDDPFHLADDLEAALRSLGEFSSDRDGYGAPAIDPAVIAAVRAFVARLPHGLAPQPRVVPMSSGTVQLVWHAGPRSLELEFESPDSIRCLRRHPEEGIEEEESFPAEDVEMAVEMIEWLMHGALRDRSPLIGPDD